MESDADLVERVRAGDGSAWGDIYDRYADRLHDHCHSILRDRHEAADALHDAFVAAAGAIDQLRDPSRLRPWLYAIARNEAFRRHRRRARVVPTDEVPEVSAVDDVVPPATDLQQLVWDAAGGLSPDDQSLLDLHLRQGLDGQDLADALGITANNAYVKLHRLRETLERSLGALLVARMGSKDCDELRQLVAGWDGTLSPLLRKRIARHVDGCEVCGERKRALVSPLALLAAVPLVPAPLALRQRIVDDAVAASSSRPAGGGGRRRPAWLLAAAAVLVLVGLVAVLLAAGSDGDDRSDEVVAAADPERLDDDPDDDEVDDDAAVADDDVAAPAPGEATPAAPVAGSPPADPLAPAAPAVPVEPTDPATPVAGPDEQAPAAGPAEPADPVVGPAPPADPGGSPNPPSDPPIVAPPPTTAPPTTAPPAAALAVGTTELAYGDAATARSLVVRNTGGRRLSVTTTGPAAVAASPGRTLLDPGESVDLTATLDRALLAEGDHRLDLTVVGSSGGAAVVEVPVAVTATVRRPPTAGAPTIAPAAFQASCNPAGDTAAVTAGVGDDSGVAAATLHWTGPDGPGSRPMAISGGTATAELGPFAGAGAGEAWVVAADVHGNAAESPRTPFTVDPCPG